MFNKAIILSLLVILSISMCGCAPLLVAGGAIAGGAGTAVWISGKLVQDLEAPFEQVVQATKYTLDSLNLSISREIKKTEVAQIKGNYIDGKTIWIDIFKVSPSASRVEVRVGTIPNKEATYKIVDRIKEYLKDPNIKQQY